MISKSDCILLLGELKKNGVNIEKELLEVVKEPSPSLDIIKFINNQRELDLTKFYNKIRKSYNNKRSNLYINIVKEIEEPQEVLTTLSAMLTQILLFSKTAQDKQMFLRHARAEEISYVLTNYFKTYDITNCLKLLRLIKADLKALELVNKKEEKV